MRTLREIASDIYDNWENVNYAAEPYLDAMSDLESVNDYYIHDSGKSVVRYFLANASSWKGDAARQIKKELKGML